MLWVAPRAKTSALTIFPVEIQCDFLTCSFICHTAMAASLSTLLCFSLETSTLWKPPTRWERQLREDLLAMMPIRYGQGGTRLSRSPHQQPLGRLPCQVSGGKKAWLNFLYNASALEASLCWKHCGNIVSHDVKWDTPLHWYWNSFFVSKFLSTFSQPFKEKCISEIVRIW